MSLDEIKRRRAETREERDKKLETAAKEVKDRQLKKMQQKKAEKAKQQKAVPKQQPKAAAAPVKKATGGKRK